jgi:cytochrome oxidase assembly protein ShyY1
MIKRLPIIPTIIVAVAVAVLVRLGVWQLHQAVRKQALLARYTAAENMPPVTWPTVPIKDAQLPLFRHATGVCLRVVGQTVHGGENQAGEPGYVHVLDCATGAEGPGMSVEVGWAKNPNVRVQWAGGPVSGIIVPDHRTRMRLVAASAPAGLEPSKTPDVSTVSPITPPIHRGYAATWFALALAALVIYGLAVRKRLRQTTPVK